MKSDLNILQGDWIERLRELPDASVHCCITSPPYWGLRKYGGWQMNCVWGNGLWHSPKDEHKAKHHLTLLKMRAEEKGIVWNRDKTAHICAYGLEPTPELYVEHTVAGFREVRRVLREDATLWLNLGDSYASDTKGSGGASEKQLSNAGSFYSTSQPLNHGLKPKDLVGVPWRVAFALQADGWYLRSDNIWHKPNPMPESVTDRPTKAHEYLFLLTKRPTYFYDADAIKEPSVTGDNRSPYGSDGAWAMDGRNKWDEGKGQPRKTDATMRNKRTVWTVDDHKALFYWLYTHAPDLLAEFIEQSRNKLDVFTVTTAPFKGTHFATFPPDLVKPCILAGTSAKGCCPKCGAPWERVIEKEYKGPAGVDYKDNGASRGKRSHSGGGAWAQWKAEHPDKYLGWEPTCSCSPEPCGDCDPCVAGHPEQCAISPTLKPTPATVIDPFAGSGTVGQVALELGRHAVLIELNPDYIKLIEQRTQVTPGLQLA